MTDRYENRLDKNNIKFNTLNPVWDNDKGDGLNVFEMIEELNALHEENIRLKRDFDSCSHNWSIMYDEAKEKVEKLTEENWELEQENERLENKLWNCQNVR